MLKFANFASTSLATNITSTATVITVEAGTGSRFPTITAPDTFQLVVFNVSGVFEIVTCTARSDDTFTIVRGREGSLPRAWNAGDRVELRVTAGVLNEFLQKSGGTMSGPLDMNNNELRNVQLPNEIQLSVLRASKLRPSSGVTTYEIGWVRFGRPTIGGPDVDDASVIVTRKELSKMVFFYTGTIPIPSPWVLCNGSNGTPNLLDRFLIMAGTNYPHATFTAGRLAAGGKLTTDAGGAIPAGVTGSTALTIAQMPAHSHTVPSGGNASGSTGYRSEGTQQSTASQTTSTVGGGQGHTHTTPAVSAHTHTISLPAYYALAPVMYNPGLL